MKTLNIRLNTAIVSIAILASALLISGCAPTTTVARGSQSEVAEELSKQEAIAVNLILSRQNRMHSVSWPLFRTSADLCPTTKNSLGFWVAKRNDVPRGLKDAWTKELNLADKPTIVSVASGSPADQAGLKKGDQLVSVGGQDVTGKWDYSKQLEKLIAELSDDGNDIQIVATRNNDTQTITTFVTPEVVCDVDVNIVNEDSFNAYTNGEDMWFHVGLIRFAENDWELQLVVAHELAHITELHVEKKKKNSLLGSLADILIAGATGTYTDTFAQVGAMAYSQEFEREADYISLYIMADAGLDTAEVANFWRRLAAESPSSNSSLRNSHYSTHPSAAERYTNIEATHLEIQEKLANGLALTPERKEE